MIGDKFGLLTATSDFYYVEKSGRKRKVVDLICNCGSEMVAVRYDTLKDCRPNRSCTCDFKNNEAFKSHGMSYSKEYKSWQAIKERCLNEKSKGYLEYGAVGIKMYEPWINSFEKFYEYLGYAPTKNHSVDRIDNDGNYEPGNIRWATQTQQLRNRGKLKTNTTGFTGVSKLNRKSGANYMAACKRLDGTIWTKSFSESVYGNEAFELACKYREMMIEQLNSEGAGYTEKSGK